MTIIEFLLARIAEDELAAEQTLVGPAKSAPPWTQVFRQIEDFDGGGQVADARSHWLAAHIARHDPDRVLAECAAKRAIVEAAAGWKHEFNPSAYYACKAYKLKEGTWKVLKVSEGKCNCGVTQQRNAILKPLAAVYADHPDYRQEWAL